MSFTVSHTLLLATTAPQLELARNNASRYAGSDEREHLVDSAVLDVQGLQELLALATTASENKLARAVSAILEARDGKFDKPIPNFGAFEAVLNAFLRANLIDGWIYAEGADGELYPELVTSVQFIDRSRERGTKRPNEVMILTQFYGCAEREGRMEPRHGSYTFTPEMVTRKKIADVFADRGIYRETEELKRAYLDSLARYEVEVRPKFASQFRLKGKAYKFDNSRYDQSKLDLAGRRVIHDLDPSAFRPSKLHTDSELMGDGVGSVPTHPLVYVFDLKSHISYWVHSDNMKAYVYDKTLRSKLILPAVQHDLLDVLTTDIEVLTADFIEGKAAGNVILAKGVPGVGKTLTAEVYAEVIEQPLYAIHTGTLGTTAEDIQENLEKVLARAKRWGRVVLLLDEADVFVARRGDNIERNAIVAEFLRVLEYFTGLLFLTTNRPSDIDEAIISRCAAIIDYTTPAGDTAVQIWQVMAAQFNSSMSEELVRLVVAQFPGIAPRDIKMLFRLALRMAAKHNEPLSVDLFRRCAMFRAIDIAELTAEVAA